MDLSVKKEEEFARRESEKEVVQEFLSEEFERRLAKQREGRLYRNFQGYSTHRGCDLVGMGMSAISSVADSYSQNAKELSQYYGRLDAGRLPVKRGYRLHDDDCLRRDVIMALMCHGHLDMAHFERRYQIDFTDYFAESLEQLAGHVADGLVTVRDGLVTLLPQGQLMLRSVAMAFDAYLGEGQRGLFSRTV